MEGDTKNLTVSIRMAPKERFLLELLAQKRRSNLSDTACFAVESAARTYLDEDPTLIDRIWDPHPADRLINLALVRPGWLTVEEEFILRAIKDDPRCWNGTVRPPDNKAEPNRDYIRTQWEELLEKSKRISSDRYCANALKSAQLALDAMKEKGTQVKKRIKTVHSG